MRRGLGDTVRRVDAEQRAPVVIEFAGPSARLLSVAERAVLASLAPQLGAAGAVFVSDEKTEVYLRDQRRSKAHRGLLPDAGAPCDDVMSVDLSAVDPLVLDEDGVVRPVRELAGKPVSQVILGGDSGTSLRDLLAAGALLKSKRVPPKLDLLLAPPSRQVLQVLAESGALVDFIATGARLLESDPRLITGELYPPPPWGVSLRTFDPEPTHPVAAQRFVVASAETLAFSVATGQIGDPRTFKRPVRVTVPRTLPTDDVLIARKGKSKGKEAEPRQTGADAPRAHGFDHAQPLPVALQRGKPERPSALVLETLDDVRWFARRAPELSDTVRAIVAPYIPSGTVQILAGLGIFALTADSETLKKLRAAPTVALPSPAECDGKPTITVGSSNGSLDLVWLAVGVEREWTSAGTARDSSVKR
jgi:aconitate hydratase